MSTAEVSGHVIAGGASEMEGEISHGRSKQGAVALIIGLRVC